MKTKNIFYAGLCALFMLTSAMCCDDEYLRMFLT